MIDEIFIEARRKDTAFAYPDRKDFLVLAINADSTDQWTYNVKLKYKDSIFAKTYEYPREYQKYQFETDTVDNKWSVKIVYPKPSQKGLMGIYIENLKVSKDWGHYPKLSLGFKDEQSFDKNKLEILRSVKMK